MGFKLLILPSSFHFPLFLLFYYFILTIPAPLRPPPRLPRRLLQLPYDILNRINRRKLLKANTDLTSSIRMEDYRICPVSDDCFDLFYVAEK